MRALERCTRAGKHHGGIVGDGSDGPSYTVPATTMKQSLPALPAIGPALLPKITCAACWPVYAGLLSALGTGFVDYTPYLLPLTAVFLVLTLAVLASCPACVPDDSRSISEHRPHGVQIR